MSWHPHWYSHLHHPQAALFFMLIIMSWSADKRFEYCYSSRRGGEVVETLTHIYMQRYKAVCAKLISCVLLQICS